MTNNQHTDEWVCLPNTDLPRVVVVGGGFAGVSLIKQLKNKPVQVVLIDKNNFHQFQPLFYQVATCGIEPDGIVFPLRKLFNGFRNFYYRMADVERIDPIENCVFTSIGKVNYDYLIIATGCITNFFGLNDVERYGMGMKNIREALDIRSLILQNLEKAVITCHDNERNALTNFAIVGGGPAGVEMAGAIAEFRKYILPKDYVELKVEDMNIYLLEASGNLLSAMSTNASEKALKYLISMGIDVRLNEAVISYDGTSVHTNSGNTLYAKTVIWTAGVKGASPSGLTSGDLGRQNRILVDTTSKLIQYNNIYAIGDIAAMYSSEYPTGHPMVAQVALQQGKLLGKNLLRMIQGQHPKSFIYKDKGAMATIGKQRAVADVGRFRFAGYFTWWLWSVIHLVSIAGFRNKLLVGINWVWSYFTYEKGNRWIFRQKHNVEQLENIE